MLIVFRFPGCPIAGAQQPTRSEPNKLVGLVASPIWKKSGNIGLSIRRSIAEGEILPDMIWSSTKTRCKVGDIDTRTSDQAHTTTAGAEVQGEEIMRTPTDLYKETVKQEGVGVGIGNRLNTTVIGDIGIELGNMASGLEIPKWRSDY